MFKVNHKNNVFVVNFEHISHLFLVFLLLNFVQFVFKVSTPNWHHEHCSCVFIINFEQILHIALMFPLLTLNK